MRFGLKKKLLIVDDEEDICELLVNVLQDDEHEIVTARNGQEGLLLARKNQFDCILTDINMPIMTGLEFIRELREESKTIPVIFFTAFNDHENMRRALKYGAFDFVSKPNFEKLKSIVQAACDSGEASKSVPGVNSVLGKIKDII